MAEIVLRERLTAHGLAEFVTVDSTGVSNEEAGNPIDYRARKLLTAHNYEPYGLGAHRARPLEVDHLRNRDLILTMTTQHARAVRRLADINQISLPLDTVRMFRSFDPAAPHAAAFQDEYLLDVADPWYGGMSDFELCLNQVEAAMDGLLSELQQRIHNGSGHR